MPVSVLERALIAIEKAVKEPLFDCRMCGQCILHSTGLVCPMRCPKNLRNGPCGGVLVDGHCEVYPDRPCVWVRGLGGFATPADLARPHGAHQPARGLAAPGDLLLEEPRDRPGPRGPRRLGGVVREIGGVASRPPELRDERRRGGRAAAEPARSAPARRALRRHGRDAAHQRGGPGRGAAPRRGSARARGRRQLHGQPGGAAAPLAAWRPESSSRRPESSRSCS